jgi:hypothetical protein
MGQFHSKLAGVTAKNNDGKNRQNYIRTYCKPEMALILKREPDNPYDSNAVAVWINAKTFFFFSSEVQIGYLNSDIAGEIARHIDGGGIVKAKITEITGGTEKKKSLGVNILIDKQ